MSKTPHPLIENHLSEIEKEIEKRRGRWTLNAICWMDFDDVKQIVLIHISKKWDQYDVKKPLIPWVSTIIANQIKNLLRNVYGNFKRPCLECPANEGGDGCRIYGTQNSNCNVYKHWEKNKKSAYDTKLPLPAENHFNEISSIPHRELDLEKTSNQLHQKMKLILNGYEYKLYDLIFIKHVDDQDIIKQNFFKTRKNAGIATLKTFKKNMLEKAKVIVSGDEIDF